MMATTGKSISRSDAKPQESKRRVVRIPFPPKNRFWELMVEKGWAVQREDEIEKKPIKIIEEPAKPKEEPITLKTEPPKIRKIIPAEVSSLVEGGGAIELVELANQSAENLGIVVHGIIGEIGKTSDFEKGLRRHDCMVYEDGLPDFPNSEAARKDALAMEVLGMLSEAALPHISNYLTSGNVDIRRKRILASFLGQSESPKHIQLLIGILGSDDSAMFLDSVENKSTLVQEEMLKALESGDYPNKTEVMLVSVLSKLGKLDALPYCSKFLLDSDYGPDIDLLMSVQLFGPHAIPAISAYLRFPNASITDRISAVHMMAAIGPQDSLDALLDVVMSQNEINSDRASEWGQVVAAAQESIIKLGSSAVPAIKPFLHDNTSRVYVIPRAIDMLGGVGCDEAVDALNEIVGSDVSSIRSRVAEALGKTKNPKALIPLKKLMNDSKPDVAADAANALYYSGLIGKMDKLEIAFCLLVSGKHGDVDFGDADVFKYLISSTRHKFPTVCKGAVLALGLSGKPDAVSTLISSLRHKNADVRASAAIALVENKEERAIKPLIEALGDDDGKVVEEASRALRKYHDTMNTQDYDHDIMSGHIISAMSHKNFRVRYAAIKIMAEIGASPAVPVLKRLALEDSESMVRAKALKTLSNFSSQNLNTIIEALGDSESEVVEIAIALLQTETLENVSYRVISSALKKHERPSVRKGAALALSRTGLPQALDMLAGAVNDSEKEVRIAVVQNIGTLAAKLVEILPEESEDSSLTKSAISDKAIKPLLKVLEDSDHDIQAESASVIARIVRASDSDVVGVDAVPHLVGILRSDLEFTRTNVVSLLNKILETCDTEEETKQYLALVEKSSKELRGLIGGLWDIVSKENGEATCRAREICMEFISLAKEKEHQFENGKDGPYR